MKIPHFYSKEKLLIAFEYGITLREAIHKPLTKEIVVRAEEIILKEFPKKTPLQLAFNMVPNLLAAIEPKEDVPPVSKS